MDLTEPYVRATDRISPTEAALIKEKLLREFKLPFTRIADSLYRVKGTKVNAKLTTLRPSGRYWFNIQRRADSYLWICWNKKMQKHDAYYWVPAQAMRKMVRRGAYRDWTWEQRGRPIPNFMIDAKTDMYVVGTTRISIGKFRGLRVPPQ